MTGWFWPEDQFSDPCPKLRTHKYKEHNWARTQKIAINRAGAGKTLQHGFPHSTLSSGQQWHFSCPIELMTCSKLSFLFSLTFECSHIWLTVEFWFKNTFPLELETTFCCLSVSYIDAGNFFLWYSASYFFLSVTSLFFSGNILDFFLIFIQKRKIHKNSVLEA